MANMQPKKPSPMPEKREEQRTPTTQASPPAAQAKSRPSQEQISKRAYEIWEAHGRPEGKDQEHWCQAERELMLGRQ